MGLLNFEFRPIESLRYLEGGFGLEGAGDANDGHSAFCDRGCRQHERCYNL
jgi:hypothetical protein